MYIHVESFDGSTISLGNGPGPLLLGQYHSGAEWRIVSSVLACVASRLSSCCVLIIGRADDMEHASYRNGAWSFLSPADLDSERGGWLRHWDGHRQIFLPASREEMEDAVYRTFRGAQQALYLVSPLDARQDILPERPSDEILEERCFVSIDAAYLGDIDVMIRRPDVTQTVVGAVAHVVRDFNQVW